MKMADMFPSKFLKAAELDGNLTLTIKTVLQEDLGEQLKPVAYFLETKKGLVINRTNANTISALHGQDTDAWAGNQITLFATEVDFKGQTTLAIRVRLSVPATPAATPPAMGLSKDQIRELMEAGLALKRVIGPGDSEGEALLVATRSALKSAASTRPGTAEELLEAIRKKLSDLDEIINGSSNTMNTISSDPPFDDDVPF
jgi:hypothetical protein